MTLFFFPFHVTDRLPQEGSEPTVGDKPSILATVHDARAQDRDHHRRHCPRCNATILCHLTRSYMPARVSSVLTEVLTEVCSYCQMQEGIAVGRSFAMFKNYNIDGNKEMIAIGTMNIVGSFTSCYLTTGKHPISDPYSTSFRYRISCC